MREHPRSSSIVMLATVVGRRRHAQPRHRRADRGAAVGHLLRRQDRADLPRALELSADRPRAHLHGRGQVFFASAEDFTAAFDFREALERVVTIDLTRAHIWDISASPRSTWRC
jgi:SulP family sulfate permease